MRKRDIALRLAVAAVVLIPAAVLLLPAVVLVAVAVLFVLNTRGKRAGPPAGATRPGSTFPESLHRPCPRDVRVSWISAGRARMRSCRINRFEGERSGVQADDLDTTTSQIAGAGRVRSSHDRPDAGTR